MNTEHPGGKWVGRMAKTIVLLGLLAIPQFASILGAYESETRSKVSRALADLRSMRTAVEAYAVDNQAYPPPGISAERGSGIIQPFSLPMRLTTPITYITTLPTDPFQRSGSVAGNPRGPYIYLTRDYLQSLVISGRTELSHPEAPGWTLHVPDLAAVEAFEKHFGEYMMWSCGPGGPDQWRRGVPFFLAYDPTNGRQSGGHIIVSQNSGSERKYFPVEDFPPKFPFLEAGTMPPVTAWERMLPKLELLLVGAACLMIPIVIGLWIYRKAQKRLPPFEEGEMR